MLVNTYYLIREAYFCPKIVVLKPLSFILAITVLFGCSSNNSNTLEKTFSGDLTLSPAENALLGFDRMVEIENDTAKKAQLINQIKAAGLSNSKNSLAIFVDNNQLESAKTFLDSYSDELILERNHEFLWKAEKDYSVLYLKDNKKSIEIGELVLSASQTDSSTTIQFAPHAKKVLSGYAMKYLNRPILVEINGQIITTVKSFGKLENGVLKIKH